MKVTEFLLDANGEVETQSTSDPAWEPRSDHDGVPLSGVEVVEHGRRAGAEFQLVRIAAGGAYAMHRGDGVAFCQVVSGAGVLGLPGGRAVAYEGPELFIFHPGTLHEWRDLTTDTLLSVCLVDV